jgi:hypothetical protein
MKSQVTKSNIKIVVCVFCILILAYIIMGFHVSKSSPSPATAILPENEFAFNPVPQDGQIGGIDGVFIQQASWWDEVMDEIDCEHYDVFRLYGDGIVLHQGVCLEGNFLESWSNIKNWFHRNNYMDLSRGKYYTSGNQIWFSTTSYYSFDAISITVDYSGTFSKRNLILDSYSHSNGNKEKNARYYKIEVKE